MLSNNWQKSSYCGEGEACVHVAATWQKSSYCAQGVSCVNVAADWQKSTHCAQGDSCLHVGTTPTTLHLTESSDPTASILTATPTAFSALLSTLKKEPSPHA